MSVQERKAIAGVQGREDVSSAICREDWSGGRDGGKGKSAVSGAFWAY